MKATLKSAVSAINEHGVLLVYPIDNRPAPHSLWSSFHPRTPMRWEWDDSGDNRVAELWHLREELSQSGKVVYAKWYQGRATFFSREIFPRFLSVLGTTRKDKEGELSSEARLLLSTLREDSPLSTKQLKLATDLRGKVFESTYERAMKQLWSRLWIVGYGEVPEGAFPSLAVGSTRSLFEDLWDESLKLDPRDAQAAIVEKLNADSLFLKYLAKVVERRVGAAPGKSRNHLSER